MKPSKKEKKIAYVTGTRADFGLMTPVLKAIEKSKGLSLQLYVTGIHLMPEFGETALEVLREFPDAKKISAVFKSDERAGMAEFTGIFLSKIVVAFEKDKPDFVLTLGDRPEMLMVAAACLYLGIPSGQIHAGDKSSTVDDTARHAITKLSSLHFVATKEAEERVMKIGEERWRVHRVGAPALDTIKKERIPSSKEASDFLGIPRGTAFLLVTQHPVSELWKEALRQMRETLEAVKSFNLPVVVLYPHADAGGRRMVSEILKQKNNPLFRIFPSVPYKMFLALERDAAVWVGNSSAMMIESASFRTPCVNVGERQSGRVRGENVIDAGYHRAEIGAAIAKSLRDTASFTRLRRIKNPWGDGRAAERIIKILEQLPDTQKLLAKQIAY